MSAHDPISTDTADSRVLTLYYDGSCPLCAAEMLWLRAGNQRRLLAFVDVAADDYQPACHGLSCERALAALHGRFDDGELLVGVPVFAAAYARAGHPVLAALYRQPLLQPFWQLAYRLFLRFRHPLSRRLGPPLLAWVRRRLATRDARAQ